MVRTARLWVLAACGLAGALAGCPKPTPPPPPPPPPPRAQLVLVGGNVVAEKPGATAVAIDDGRIVDVGTDEQLEPWIGDETQVVGLDGRTVMPGLADAHMHLGSLGVRRFGLDLVGTASIEEIQNKVAEAVANTKPGVWIRGRGWDQNDWEEFQRRRKKFPTAKDLDIVSPENPVILTRVDGHAVWVNSRAMEVAGITRRTRRVKGGQIIKARGRPTGIFIDNAIALVRKAVPELTGDELERAYTLAQNECLAAGLTSIHDMGVDASGLRVMRKMDTEGRLKLRVYAMHDWTGDTYTSTTPVIPDPMKSRLTVRGVKLMADGALGSRGAALLQRYSDDRRNSGQLLISKEELGRRVKAANDAGLQVATHAIGDKANRVVLDVYEAVLGTTGAENRPRIEHAQVLHPDDIPRFGQLSIIASVQPTHATSDMPWAEQRVGKDRIKGAYAWQSLLTSNATIAAGSDAPVEDVSPILGLYAAITRKDLFGTPRTGLVSGTAPPAEGGPRRLHPRRRLRRLHGGPARQDRKGLPRRPHHRLREPPHGPRSQARRQPGDADHHRWRDRLRPTRRRRPTQSGNLFDRHRRQPLN